MSNNFESNAFSKIDNLIQKFPLMQKLVEKVTSKVSPEITARANHCEWIPNYCLYYWGKQALVTPPNPCCD